jgi:hypothetical protein
MRILIKSTVLLIIVSILMGCTQEVLIRSIVLLVLVSTLIGCIQAYTGPIPYLYLLTHIAPNNERR